MLETYQKRYNHFIVLIRSDRKKVTTGLIKEVDSLYDQIASREKSLQSSDVLSRYRFYKTSSEQISDTFSTLLFIHSLDENFDDTKHLQFANKIQERFALIASDITFAINAKKDAAEFEDVIRASLTDNKMRVIPAAQSNSSTLFIELDASAVTSNAYGFHVVHVNLNIDVRDHSGNSIGGTQFTLTGQATQSSTHALKNCVEKFKKRVTALTLGEVIGLEL